MNEPESYLVLIIVICEILIPFILYFSVISLNSLEFEIVLKSNKLVIVCVIFIVIYSSCFITKRRNNLINCSLTCVVHRIININLLIFITFIFLLGFIPNPFESSCAIWSCIITISFFYSIIRMPKNRDNIEQLFVYFAVLIVISYIFGLIFASLLY